jgi:hypothetical protein
MIRTAKDIKKEIKEWKAKLTELEDDLDKARKAGTDPSAIHVRINRFEGLIDKANKELESISGNRQTPSGGDYQKIVKKATAIVGGSVIKESRYDSITPKTTVNNADLVRIDSMQKSIREKVKNANIPIVRDKKGNSCITAGDFYSVLNS